MANRILIVEDSRAARRALASLLAKVGLVPVEAGTVAQGLEMLARSVDVICLDLVLPDGNGLEILQQVRRENLPMKVAIISGADDPELLAQVTALRPEAIFGKPLDVQDFLNWLTTSGITTGTTAAQSQPSYQIRSAQSEMTAHATDRKKCA